MNAGEPVSVPSKISVPTSAATTNQFPPQQALPDTHVPGKIIIVGQHEVEIIKYLAEGGFAKIYVVKFIKYIENVNNEATAANTVLKAGDMLCLKIVMVQDQNGLNEMRNEVDVMKKLKGAPNIVQYYDSSAARRLDGAVGYEVLLLMELCPNKSLLDYMNQRLQTKLSEGEVLKIMLDVTLAVAQMHYLGKPLIHRDIKIENVLVDSKNNFKLCDFGSTSTCMPVVSSHQDIAILTQNIYVHTTPQYRSPEMIDLYRCLPIDEKSDIWALGIFLYKLLFYTTPFERAGQFAILHSKYEFPPNKFSSKLINLIIIMLAENPNLRPNIYQVLDQLCAITGMGVPLKDIYGLGSYDFNSYAKYQGKLQGYQTEMLQIQFKRTQNRGLLSPSDRRYLDELFVKSFEISPKIPMSMGQYPPINVSTNEIPKQGLNRLPQVGGSIDSVNDTSAVNKAFPERNVIASEVAASTGVPPVGPMNNINPQIPVTQGPMPQVAYPQAPFPQAPFPQAQFPPASSPQPPKSQAPPQQAPFPQATNPIQNNIPVNPVNTYPKTQQTNDTAYIPVKPQHPPQQRPQQPQQQIPQQIPQQLPQQIPQQIPQVPGQPPIQTLPTQGSHSQKYTNYSFNEVAPDIEHNSPSPAFNGSSNRSSKVSSPDVDATLERSASMLGQKNEPISSHPSFVTGKLHRSTNPFPQLAAESESANFIHANTAVLGSSEFPQPQEQAPISNSQQSSTHSTPKPPDMMSQQLRAASNTTTASRPQSMAKSGGSNSSVSFDNHGQSKTANIVPEALQESTDELKELASNAESNEAKALIDLTSELDALQQNQEANNGKVVNSMAQKIDDLIIETNIPAQNQPEELE